MSSHQPTTGSTILFAATLLSTVFICTATVLQAAGPVSYDVFVSGADGYAGYRIPAIEVTPIGTLVAFAEARKHNLADPGFGEQDIDLVYKTSSDGGKTWSNMIIMEDPGEFWSTANPCTLVDRELARVWVFYIRSEPQRSSETSRPKTRDMMIFARYSDDNARTWSDHTDRCHQGLGNELIVPLQRPPNASAKLEAIERLGGLLRSYRRAA